MIVETELLKKYKEYLLSNSTFKDILKVVPTTPRNYVNFPVIVFRERENTDSIGNLTLDRTEYVDSLLYQVDIYTKDIVLDKKYNARDVINELRTLTSNFFRELGFIRVSDTSNDTLVAELKRRTMTFEGNISSWNGMLNYI